MSTDVKNADNNTDRLRRILNMTDRLRYNSKVAITEKGVYVSDEDKFINYPEEKISKIETGKDTSDATAVAEDIAQDKTAYARGEKIIGTAVDIPAGDTLVGDGLVASATAPDSSDFIMAYVYNGGNTNKMMRKTARVGGAIPYSTLAALINLTADKIKKDEEILNVVGTYAGIDTSDADATANDLLEGKTAYVDGEKITGTKPYLESMDLEVNEDNLSENDDKIEIDKQISTGGAVDSNTDVKMILSMSDLASFIGLSPEILLEGNIVLEIEGTASQGITPTGTIEIESNGNYDVSNYASASVNINTNFVVPDGMKFANSGNTSFGENMDFSNITDAEGLFQNCVNLTTLPDTLQRDNITKTRSMYDGCASLGDEQIASHHFESEDISYMFRGCGSLIDLGRSRDLWSQVSKICI